MRIALFRGGGDDRRHARSEKSGAQGQGLAQLSCTPASVRSTPGLVTTI